MKLSPLFLLSLTLSAGLMQAFGQGGKPLVRPRIAVLPINPSVIPPQYPDDVPLPPGYQANEPEDTLLGVNYRIVITATANGAKMGELAALTCTSPFEMTGYLVKPTAEDEFGASLAVRGALAEVEGGSLKLSYAMVKNAPVPMHSWGSQGAAPPFKTVYSFKKTGASGVLLLKPGQSYEVARITGVVYSLSITPTETPPAPKVEPDAKKQAEAEPGTQPPAEGPPPETSKPDAARKRGPSEEDRKRYESLSEAGQEKFREAMREKFRDAEFRNSPEEERRAVIRRLFDKAAAEDQAKTK